VSEEPNSGVDPAASASLEPVSAVRGGLIRELGRVASLDVAESFRARWFAFYSLSFGGVVVLLFVFGLTESRVLGFLGLSRLLVTYIQLCIAILPIFVLVTTVRSVAGDREAGVLEYLLALPVSLGGWYWGRLFGRFLVVFLPAALAMTGAAGWAVFREIPVERDLFLLYTAMLAALAWCFLGIGMLISSLARSIDTAQGAAFAVWLILILFLDMVLLGMMVQGQIPAESIIAVALANPLQVFRTAAMLLFDPDLILLGPSALVILDTFGNTGYLIWAHLYPIALGTVCAALGFVAFRRGDLVG
jgi:ABC-2 type transport system permease protein